MRYNEKRIGHKMSDSNEINNSAQKPELPAGPAIDSARINWFIIWLAMSSLYLGLAQWLYPLLGKIFGGTPQTIVDFVMENLMVTGTFAFVGSQTYKMRGDLPIKLQKKFGVNRNVIYLTDPIIVMVVLGSDLLMKMFTGSPPLVVMARHLLLVFAGMFLSRFLGKIAFQSVVKV
jgi:hypothetical protein